MEVQLAALELQVAKHVSDVYVRQDGTIELETINRGESAARWVATLRGKKRLCVVDGAGRAES